MNLPGQPQLPILYCPCPLQVPQRSDLKPPFLPVSALAASEDTEVQRCVLLTSLPSGSQQLLWPLEGHIDLSGSPRPFDVCTGFSGSFPHCLQFACYVASSSLPHCPSGSLPANAWEDARVPSSQRAKAASC